MKLKHGDRVLVKVVLANYSGKKFCIGRIYSTSEGPYLGLYGVTIEEDRMPIYVVLPEDVIPINGLSDLRVEFLRLLYK